jgi:hypothetical protein
MVRTSARRGASRSATACSKEKVGVSGTVPAISKREPGSRKLEYELNDRMQLLLAGALNLKDDVVLLKEEEADDDDGCCNCRRGADTDVRVAKRRAVDDLSMMFKLTASIKPRSLGLTDE